MRALRPLGIRWPTIIITILAGACKPSLIAIKPDDVASSMTALPAGDSVKLRATLWSHGDELTTARELSPGPLGFTWKLSALTQGPAAASLSPGAVVHGRLPGKVRIYASARGVGESIDMDVVWPLDSIELRFAARAVRVGDTVELLHRAHFVSGEISTESFRGYVTDGLEAKSPRKGDRRLSGWSALGLHANAVAWDPPVTRRLGDTVLYVAQRPGVFRVGGTFYNRWAEDTLRIEPSDGVARSFRQPSAVALKRRASAVACFTLDLREWTMDGNEWPSNWPSPKKFYDWIPRAIALDTTPLIRTAPGEGYRLDAARGPATRMGRSWILLPGRASIEIRLLSPKEYPRANSRAFLSLRVDMKGDTAFAGIAGDDQVSALVSGRRIPCGIP